MTKPAVSGTGQAGCDLQAAKLELDAALLAFEAACWRADAARLSMATEAAHAALQNRLDAYAANLALARREAGL